jgi:hypothetical protein
MHRTLSFPPKSFQLPGLSEITMKHDAMALELRARQIIFAILPIMAICSAWGRIHLRQNLDAAGLELPSDIIADLNTIATNAVAG